MAVPQKLKTAISVLVNEGLGEFTQRSARSAMTYTRIFLDYIKDWFVQPFAIMRIQKVHTSNVETLIDFASNCMGVIRPLQLRNELLPLLLLISTKKPQSVLEIGTLNGGTLFLFTHLAAPSAQIISIDLRGGMFGGGYPRWKVPLYKSFARDSQKIHLLCMDSHSQITHQHLKNILGNQTIDFLFIDGDHSYQGVKRDFEMYSAFVSTHGIIAVHDIVPGRNSKISGVNKFWNEIKYHYHYVEFVDDWKQGACGIGVIFIGTPPKNP